MHLHYVFKIIIFQQIKFCIIIEGLENVFILF